MPSMCRGMQKNGCDVSWVENAITIIGAVHNNKNTHKCINNNCALKVFFIFLRFKNKHSIQIIIVT